MNAAAGSVRISTYSRNQIMHILLVEDEPKSGDYLRRGLTESGFVVDWVQSGIDGLHNAQTLEYKLIILDVMLPGMNGWDILRELRRTHDTPVLFLTARDEIEDRVKGLELGADDYLVKPFAFTELLARVRTLLRRGPSRESDIIEYAGVQLDVLRRKVTRDGQRIDLTAKEFALLHMLIRRPGEVLSRPQIASQKPSFDDITSSGSICTSGDYHIRGCCTYLYHSLYVQLERRDDEELIGKSRSIDHLVQEAGSIESIRGNKHAMLDTISGHDQLLVLITDSSGATILKNYVGRSGVGTPLFNSLKTTQVNALQSIDLDGASARLIASKPKTSAGEETIVVVARTASDRMELLSEYRTEVWYAASIDACDFGKSARHQARHPLGPKELHDIVESFNAMLDRLHRSFEQLTQFSADLAHDLRTPLNNLMVQTQVALGKQRSIEEYQGLLSSNIEEYERLARMMESMLFLARAENAHVAVKPQMLNVEDELAKIADYFEGIAEEAKVRIVVGGTGEIFADPMLLRRAVGNLISNAIRYTPEERIIRVEATDVGNATILTVSNPGEGIPPDVVGRIFDRFYRADPSRSSASGSSGLGLAIVRSIMTLHGGEAAVKSIQGERTIFSLTFFKEAKIMRPKGV
ncbi:hypothetical protein Lal_00037312 [Lupinus albus]|nr:hypothetical protein Lal_00037312 [Lupinus albus]